MAEGIFSQPLTAEQYPKSYVTSTDILPHWEGELGSDLTWLPNMGYLRTLRGPPAGLHLGGALLEFKSSIANFFFFQFVAI